jgi:AcrR family transcriptional regulator
MTKGTLYYPFDSKESIAASIIAMCSATLLTTFVSVCRSAAPALENLIHSTFVITDRMCGRTTEAHTRASQ